jgi:hypothetical protein
MRKWGNLGSLVILAACGLLLVAGCTLGPPRIEGAEQDAVLAYAEPATDNMLAGLLTGDHAQFSRDMGPQMLKAMSESELDALRAMLEAKLGGYVSRQVSSMQKNGNLVTVVYDAQFEEEEHVTMRVVFDQDRRISGLWFDSPKLRQQQ